LSKGENVKKILILILSIGLIFSLAGISTQAYYSDLETSTGNTLTAGVWEEPEEALGSASLENLKAITAFSFQELTPAVIGKISEDTRTISLMVPFGTDVTSLIPTITINGDSVDPASGLAQDFTNPVSYQVSLPDSSTQIYIAAVTTDKESLSTVTSIVSGSYIITDNSISDVPFETSKTDFLGKLTKGQDDQTWDDTGISDPVVSDDSLVVIAQDGITTANYIITVDDAPDTEAPIIIAPADQAFEATGPETAPALIEATAVDLIDPNPVITYTPDSFPVGVTVVIWTATDASGNSSSASSNVRITDTTAPLITLNGITPEIEIGGSYTELGATAADVVDGKFPAIPSGAVDTNTAGSYIITYAAADSAGNNAIEVTRTVIVK